MITADFAILDKTKPPPPPYVRVPKPTFRTNAERERYWDEQRRRWHEGYAGLTGLHYFALQECKIPDGRGRPIRPWWRDGDALACESLREAGRLQWDLFFLKRREFGLSGLFGGVAPLYYAMLNPGSEIIMTSADKDRIKLLFGKKLMTTYQELDPDIQSPNAKTRQEGYLFLAEEVKAKGRRTTYRGLQSQIWCKETVKNPAAFEAFRSVYGFLDELFLHPAATDVRNSAARCFMDGSEKIGTLVMGGSCGIGTTQGVEEGKKIYADSKNLKILTCFLPGTLCIKQFSINGHSDQKAALDWIMRERELLYQAEDKRPYWKFVADYPLSEDEVLGMTSDSVIPEDLMIQLNEAEKSIRAESVRENRYRIEPDENTGRLRAVPDSRGKHVIIEMPQPGHSYGSGTDPIPFGNASLEEGSEYANIIKNRTTQRHVAYYMERNLNVGAVLHEVKKLQTLYFEAATMLEFNRGEVIMKEYVDAGLKHLLAPMPVNLGIKWEKRTYPFGFGKNNKTEPRFNKIFMSWLYRHASNIRIRTLIDEIKAWTRRNTDLLDAAIAEAVDEEEAKYRARKASMRVLQPVEVCEVYRGADGKTHRRTKQVRVDMDRTQAVTPAQFQALPKPGGHQP